MPPKGKGRQACAIRRSFDRGQTVEPWLQSYHSFTFGSYRGENGLGCLKVVNEDRVKGGRGFGEHEHSDAEVSPRVCGTWQFLAD